MIYYNVKKIVLQRFLMFFVCQEQQLQFYFVNIIGVLAKFMKLGLLMNKKYVRKTVCLLENTDVVVNSSNIEEKGFGGCKKDVHDAGCGHYFHSLYWKNYITKSIEDGPAGCLNLRCLDPSCSVPAGQDLIKKIVSAKDNVMYLRYLVRSYVEGNHNTIKLCPAAHCDYAVEYKYKVSCRGNFDVTCMCTYSFCWKCMEEAHSPVDCDTAANWMSRRNMTKSLNWILDNCTLCPECKQPIETKDNKDAFHMTCVCGFIFCWVCLSPWQDKHICWLYEDEKRRNMAKSLNDGYTRYYEKWEANESLRKKAKKDLQKLQAVYVEKLKNVQGMTSAELSFIIEAWQLIIECRRVLKWTYTYRYYLPEAESKNHRLFEYLQGEAESCLERLHHFAEKDMLLQLQLYLDDGYGSGFNVFRENLSNLTNVTQDLFMKLVQELENGHLVDAGSLGACTNSDISLTKKFTKLELS
ncbi:hypothetical protein AQUCO_03200078v1 [Aquilegia coerulea]|uniref:RBR-type E3 ubiquitin transferase n=1 Tax=Aquilegia coerulea TaxID=218851 RepID=A0A2G5D021_AQUCA|nr:hypothetical protein AQUCO_03200078v1 [Aquilegia coerulea]PIA36859.1 hypothetical protein AQUCO_03200078v1 [Aquilegia coerulea]